ncbi:hypothetical protein K435DRAFT_799835 [Dendrothele bispora CBS 962.96]|uniref:Uncharacterized protein n=1 Tax=Dendrothele bispora (strain CBS 962.96) TaxID=1314807 RepID=A0A4S8LUJ5_DENBC|nr:hypothetical protein K435DRAFT_799835 [Dendrothele bispora CBS 962.96]
MGPGTIEPVLSSASRPPPPRPPPTYNDEGKNSPAQTAQVERPKSSVSAHSDISSTSTARNQKAKHKAHIGMLMEHMQEGEKKREDMKKLLEDARAATSTPIKHGPQPPPSPLKKSSSARPLPGVPLAPPFAKDPKTDQYFVQDKEDPTIWCYLPHLNEPEYTPLKEAYPMFKATWKNWLQGQAGQNTPIMAPQPRQPPSLPPVPHKAGQETGYNPVGKDHRVHTQAPQEPNQNQVPMPTCTQQTQQKTNVGPREPNWDTPPHMPSGRNREDTTVPQNNPIPTQQPVEQETNWFQSPYQFQFAGPSTFGPFPPNIPGWIPQWQNQYPQGYWPQPPMGTQMPMQPGSGLSTNYHQNTAQTQQPQQRGGEGRPPSGPGDTLCKAQIFMHKK